MTMNWIESLGGRVDEYGNIVFYGKPQKEKVKSDIPIWEKYTLSIEEASQLFRIGENRLRSIINADPNKDFILWNGNRAQIKRNLFGKYIDSTNAI